MRTGALRDDDEGFDEVAVYGAPATGNRVTDPGIGDCFSVDSPQFKPASRLAESAVAPPAAGFFSVAADFVGAFEDGADDWDAGGWVRWID